MSYSERWKMQDAFNTVSRDLGRFFQQWDVILTPTFAKPTPLLGEKKYLTLSDNPDVMDWFYTLWAIFSYTPACQPDRHRRDLCPAGLGNLPAFRWVCISRPVRVTTACCCNSPHNWNARWAAVLTRTACRKFT